MYKFLGKFFDRPAVLNNLRFVTDLEFAYDKKFITDKAQLSYVNDSKELWGFNYKCGASESIKSDLRELDGYIGKRNYKVYIDFRKTLAQLIVLRECIKRLYECNISDHLCIIKKMASQEGLNMSIFKPGDHGFTDKTIKRSRIEDWKVVIPKETLKVALLYSNKDHFYFLGRHYSINFNFTILKDEQDNLLPTYLILLYTKDKNLKKDENLKRDEDVCSICLGEFEGHDLLKSPICIHKFHKSCWEKYTEEVKNAYEHPPGCTICRKDINLNNMIEEKANIEVYKKRIMKVERLNAPLTKFYQEYDELTKNNPHQFIIFDERKVIDTFINYQWYHKETNETVGSNLISYLKVFYLDLKKQSNDIKKLP